MRMGATCADRLARMTPDQLADATRTAVLAAVADGALALDATAVPDEITVERPRNPEHGDYATNVALQLAKAAGVAPRVVAEAVAQRLRSVEGVARSISPVPASSTSPSTPRLWASWPAPS